jgi:hypothetical protein
MFISMYALLSIINNCAGQVSSITVKSVNIATFGENNFIKMAYNSKPPPRESNQMVFGIRAVIEAILAGKEIEALYIQRGLGGGLLTELRDVLNEYGIYPGSRYRLKS